MKNEHGAVDIAKLIMAILVVSLHVYPFEGINETLHYYTINWFSRVAVPFFFICTGFFLYSSLESGNKENIKKYCVHILQLYLLWTIIYIPLIVHDRIIGKNYGILKHIFLIGRDLVFSGSYTQLWYLPSTLMAVGMLYLCWNRMSRWKILALGIALYVCGLLTQSYFGLLKLLVVEGSIVWNMLKGMQLIMATSRNGIFFGFLFMLIGVFIGERYSLNQALGGGQKYGVLFVIFDLLFLGETWVLRKNDWVRDGNMYIFMVPTVTFLFLNVLGRKAEKELDYVLLRKMSTLIFLIHLWVAYFIKKWDRLNSLEVYLSVVLISLLISYFIARLGSKRFKILRKLY